MVTLFNRTPSGPLPGTPSIENKRTISFPPSSAVPVPVELSMDHRATNPLPPRDLLTREPVTDPLIAAFRPSSARPLPVAAPPDSAPPESAAPVRSRPTPHTPLSSRQGRLASVKSRQGRLVPIDEKPEFAAGLIADHPMRLEAPDTIRRKRAIMFTMFFGLQGFALFGAFYWGANTAAVIGMLLGGYLGMIVHEVVLHRMLAHRAFRTSDRTRFWLALLATCWPTRSPIWWAATHRHHHKHADTPSDTHAPSKGWWWSYAGWAFDPAMLMFGYDEIGDLRDDRRLRLLDRVFQIPALLTMGLAAVAGWACGVAFPETGMTALHGFIWWGILRGVYPSVMFGFLNVLCHMPGLGERRYETSDNARNNALLGFLAAGAGWHNNHHHYPHSARAGFFPGEFDPSYVAILLLQQVGLATHLRDVPEAVLHEGQRAPERAQVF